MDAFSAISDPVRRDLLEQVASGPARVVDLSSRHPISRPAVSKHLRLLVEAGLVVAHDRGRERHYTLVPGALGSVSAFLQRLTPAASPVVSPVTSQALDALDTEVRRVERDRRTSRRTSARTRQESA
jgi:DNA-binding transcriptional ArsR family regulator